jgi:hypothetical protein
LHLHAAISERCAVLAVGGGGAAVFECGRVVLFALELSGDEGESEGETVLKLEDHGPEAEEDGMPSAVAREVEQVWCRPVLEGEDGDGNVRYAESESGHEAGGLVYGGMMRPFRIE